MVLAPQQLMQNDMLQTQGEVFFRRPVKGDQADVDAVVFAAVAENATIAPVEPGDLQNGKRFQQVIAISDNCLILGLDAERPGLAGK